MALVAPEGAELVEPLGSGAIFQVALVRERGRLLVCKRLAPRTRSEPAGRAAIVREARFLALAKHPSLPALVRVGVDGHGPFVVETRAPGISFRTVIEGWKQRGAPVPAALVAHLALASATALAALHALADADGPLDLVHGDLGPDHLFLGPIGEVSLVDFGAARFRGMEPTLETGDRGTLPYVAPEIARGEARSSAATDVYALAATLLHLATGEPLLAATDEPAMLIEVGERGLPPDRCARAAGLDETGREALRRALAFAPEARVRDAATLQRALDPASDRAPQPPPGSLTTT